MPCYSPKMPQFNWTQNIVAYSYLEEWLKWSIYSSWGSRRVAHENSRGCSEFENDFSTRTWLTWCKSQVPVWLTPGFVIFFDPYVPTRFESSREDVPVPRVPAFREPPKHGACMRRLRFPCSSLQTRCTGQGSFLPYVVLLSSVSPRYRAGDCNRRAGAHAAGESGSQLFWCPWYSRGKILSM